MGQGAEDADIAYDVIQARGIDPDVYYGTKRRKSRVSFSDASSKPKQRKQGSTVVHKPANDDEAKALIAELDHYEWDTHKISGRFDRNPYTLTARIDGVKHRIKIAGRFGGVLRWLDRQERARFESSEAA